MAFCKECGSALDEDAKFCMECGTPVSDSTGKGTASAGNRQTPVYSVKSLENLPEGHVVDNRYEIREKIGQGGFGAVYRVYDRKMEIDKALKILTEEVASDREAMEKLRKEATTMARLNHPNIVRVYDFNEQGPLKYIDMECVDGQSLRDLKLSFTQKKLSEKKAVILARQITRGMAYAHREKVIHRDIKPQNILISRKSGVKIMDFGISETVRHSMSRVANSVASGTLVYMAPEQLKGKDVGREADIYSFGALLYDLVSGKPPFYKGDVTYQVLNEQPQPIPHVSERFNAFLLKCLAKEYTDRYRSFDEVYEVLKKEDKLSSRIYVVEPVNTLPKMPEVKEDVHAGPENPEVLPEVYESSNAIRRPGFIVQYGWSLFLAMVFISLVAGGFGLLGADTPTEQVFVPQPKGRLTNSLGMEFVYIEPGSFERKIQASEPGPTHVTLATGYYVQTTEVTQGQWRRVMGSNPSFFSDCGDDCPVEKVSWNDIQEFIRKLNHMEKDGTWRLPTEAEWEYACRAGSDTPYADGNNLDDMGWYRENAQGSTHAVGRKKPNAWGLYDMHGNVWEWCVSVFEDGSSVSDTDPTDMSSGLQPVLRGGGWLSEADSCRSGVQSAGAPGSRLTNLGFRLAYSSEQSLASVQ